MRTVVRTALAVALLGAAALTAATTAAAAAANTAAYPAPSRGGRTYSIPVGGISDVGDLTKVANLGYDLTGLLGH